MESLSPGSLIRTTDEQREAIDLLEEMMSENFKSSPSPKNAFRSPFSNSFYSFLLKEINALGRNRETVEKYLKKTLAEVKDLSGIKITLATYPDITILSVIENWLNKNGLERCVFDISTDPKILGGAIIIGQKGQYKDYSLSSEIDNFLKMTK